MLPGRQRRCNSAGSAAAHVKKREDLLRKGRCVRPTATDYSYRSRQGGITSKRSSMGRGEAAVGFWTSRRKGIRHDQGFSPPRSPASLLIPHHRPAVATKIDDFLRLGVVGRLQAQVQEDVLPT